MEIQLDCGRTVSVEQLLYRRTYYTVVDGQPNAVANDHILRTLPREIERIAPTCPIHIVPPGLEESDPDHPRLPPDLLILELQCRERVERGHKPRYPWLSGSALAVAVFTGPCLDRPMVQVVYEAIRSLSWDVLAEDYED